MTIGERIKAARKVAKLSQRELSALIGWGRNRLCDIEVGDGSPPTKVELELIEKALRMPENELQQHYKERPWCVQSGKRGLFLKGFGKRKATGFGSKRRSV